jgi:hypothetical protein
MSSGSRIGVLDIRNELKNRSQKPAITSPLDEAFNRFTRYLNSCIRRSDDRSETKGEALEGGADFIWGKAGDAFERL